MNVQNINQKIYRFIVRALNDTSHNLDAELYVLAHEIFELKDEDPIGTFISLKAEDGEIITSVWDGTGITGNSGPGDSSIDCSKLFEENDFIKYSKIIYPGLVIFVGETSIWMVSISNRKRSREFNGISINPNPREDAKRMKSLVSPTTQEPRDRVYVLTLNTNARGGLVDYPLSIEKNVNLDIKTHYNDDLPYDKIRDFILDPNKSGIALFHGDVGTGKTTFIRHLIELSQDKNYKVVILTASLMTQVGTPAFITYCCYQEPGTIFIMEDCEAILEARTKGNVVMSDILNISDGIIGKSNKNKFIFTFNTDTDNLDKAIIRPGRLMVRYDFGKLSLEKTRALYPSAKEPMTLAEIYNEIIGNPVKNKRKKVGF
jgi:hypothetical protein